MTTLCLIIFIRLLAPTARCVRARWRKLRRSQTDDVDVEDDDDDADIQDENERSIVRNRTRYSMNRQHPSPPPSPPDASNTAPSEAEMRKSHLEPAADSGPQSHFTYAQWWRLLRDDLNQPRMYVLMEWAILLIYPAVARKSLQSFSCVPAGVRPDGSEIWLLYDDPIIECYTPEYMPMAFIAGLGVVFYCLGLPLVFFVLAWRFHGSKDEDNLARVHLLTASYQKQFWYFESLLLLHKLFFTGGILIIKPGQRVQIWAGSFACLFVFIMYLRTAPFRHRICDVVQMASLMQLLLTYITAFLFYSDGGDGVIDPNDNVLGAALIGVNCLCFIILFTAITANFVITGRRALLERLRYESTADTFFSRMFESGQAVQLEKVDPKVFDHLPGVTLTKKRPKAGFHLFLSHAWPHGQDVMKLVKQRVLRMIPSATVFLDVDDLKSGSGSTEVDHSHVILVYCQPSYFRKPNCIKELFRAIIRDKPLLVVVDEMNAEGDGFGRKQIEQLLRDESKDSAFRKVAYKKVAPKVADWAKEWKLDSDDADLTLPKEWDPVAKRLNAPSPERIIEKLFEFPVIQWQHISSLQDVTMRLVGERILPETLEAFSQGKDGTVAKTTSSEPSASSEEAQGAQDWSPPRVVYINGDESRKAIELKPVEEQSCLPWTSSSDLKFYLYCSPHNVGANEVVDELNARESTKGEVTKTSDLEQLPRCEHMLLHLSGATFAKRPGYPSREESQRIDTLVADIKAAHELGVHILTVYEKPMSDGIDSTERYAVSFEDVMESTPPELKGRAPVEFEALGPSRPVGGKLLKNEALSEELRKREESVKRKAHGKLVSDYVFSVSQDVLEEVKFNGSDVQEGDYVRGGKYFYFVKRQVRQTNIFSEIAVSLCAKAWRAPGLAAIVARLSKSHEQMRQAQKRENRQKRGKHKSLKSNLVKPGDASADGAKVETPAEETPAEESHGSFGLKPMATAEVEGAVASVAQIDFAAVEARASKLFELVDGDKSGGIDFDEFNVVYPLILLLVQEATGEAQTSAPLEWQLREQFVDADTDGTGAIDYNEFVALLKRLLKIPESTPAENAKLPAVPDSNAFWKREQAIESAAAMAIMREQIAAFTARAEAAEATLAAASGPVKGAQVVAQPTTAPLLAAAQQLSAAGALPRAVSLNVDAGASVSGETAQPTLNPMFMAWLREQQQEEEEVREGAAIYIEAIARGRQVRSSFNHMAA